MPAQQADAAVVLRRDLSLEVVAKRVRGVHGKRRNSVANSVVSTAQFGDNDGGKGPPRIGLDGRSD